MKVRKRSGQNARLVLVRMVTDKFVLGPIAAKWNGDMLATRAENLIGRWAVKHYRKYGKAPKRAITSYYDEWCERNSDEEVVEYVTTFLETLSNDAKRADQAVDFILDLADRVFSKVQIKKLNDETQAALLADDLDKAVAAIAKFRKVEVASSSGHNVYAGGVKARDAFSKQNEVLIKFGQPALDQFFSTSLAREEFIAFEAPDKRGKCLDGKSQVPLVDGRVLSVEKIVETKEKGPVWAMNIETRLLESVEISDWFNNGIKTCVEIITRSGRKIVTTENHKFYTPDGWQTLRSMDRGSFIAVPRRVPSFGRKQMNPFKVRFLAYMLAEGCCVQNYWNGTKHGQACMFSNIDPVIQRDFVRSCEELNIGYKPMKDGRGFHLSKMARPILRQHGIMGCSARTKRIPKDILTLPKTQLADFLRVFFTCDGCIHHSARGSTNIELTLANKIMLRQISHLLHRFGIAHTFSTKKTTFKGRRFPAWRINIRSREYVNVFLDEINFISYKRTVKLPETTFESLLDRIPTIEARRLYVAAAKELDGLDVPMSLNIPRGRNMQSDQRTRKQMGKSFDNLITQTGKNMPIRKQTFMGIRETQAFQRVFDSDLQWEEITRIRQVGKRQTYDLAIPEHHNFIANDCIVHNSFFLQEMSYQGIIQNRKVAFFEAGDQSFDQIMRRFAARAAERPIKADDCVRYPVELESGSPIQIVHETRKYKTAMTGKEASIALKSIGKKHGRDSLKLCVYPNDSLNVLKMESILDEWKRDGWVPDIIVVDYPDIMAPNDRRDTGRDAVNSTWKALRGLNQRTHCCLIVATQSDADGYDANILTRSNFSEDKRKNAHVTGMIGINQTATEKTTGVFRLNWILARDLEFGERTCVTVASCLPYANPMVMSVFNADDEA